MLFFQKLRHFCTAKMVANKIRKKVRSFQIQRSYISGKCVWCLDTISVFLY